MAVPMAMARTAQQNVLDQVALNLVPVAGDVAPPEEGVASPAASTSTLAASMSMRPPSSADGRSVTWCSVITLDAVSKRYGADSVAVAELSLDVPDGEICVLVGPSGCGKTTTLRMINRLIEPSGGRILIDGTDVLKLDPVQLRRSIGYVIQQGGLFPHRRVGDNVATVPRLLGWDKNRVDARVDELLDLVGLEPAQYRRRFPHELSGGERQRVGVARALGGDPPVLLMDEPFGAVDPVTRQRLQQQLLQLQEQLHKTIVFVTHDIEEATILGNRIAVLSKGGTSSSTTRRARCWAGRRPPSWPTSSGPTAAYAGSP